MATIIPTIEDTDLLQRFLSSGEGALREEMILRYVPLVHYVLGRLGIFRSQGADYEDAASQGTLGLMDAVDHFDPTFQAQFSTYAIHRIRGRVLDHLRSLDWMTRSARRRTRTVQQATQELWSSLGRAPSDQELAAHLGLDAGDLQQALMDASRVIVSLDTVTDAGDDEEGSLYETLADDSQPDPSQAFEEDDLKNCLVTSIQSLSEREQLVLSLYYFEELTFKEVGAVIGVSESRVCQLHSRAVMNIRSILTQTSPSASSAQ